MRRNLERRLERLESVMRGPWKCTVVRIRGGLPDQDDCRASAGELRFQREPCESREAFEDRVLEAAEEAGKPCVVFGGLPLNMPK